jgi:hypothetical protein
MHLTRYRTYAGATLALNIDVALGVQEGVGPALLLSLVIASFVLVDRADPV